MRPGKAGQPLSIMPICGWVQADPQRHTAGTWHTRIFLVVDHKGLSNYRGRFSDFDIDRMFDDDLSNSGAEVTLPVSSMAHTVRN